MFDLLLESSHRDDSNKRSNIGFGKKIMEFASIEVYFTHVIWSCEYAKGEEPNILIYFGLAVAECQRWSDTVICSF